MLASTVLKSLASGLKDVDVGSLSAFLCKRDRLALCPFLLPAMQADYHTVKAKIIFLGLLSIGWLAINSDQR